MAGLIEKIKKYRAKQAKAGEVAPKAKPKAKPKLKKKANGFTFKKAGAGLTIAEKNKLRKKHGLPPLKGK